MQIEIVAEVAQGFEGRPEQARLLMKAAAAAKADAVKYQLVYADELATPDYKHFDLFRSLEMDDAVWEDLAETAKKSGIRLYVDVFGSRSLQLADRLGLSAIKLHPTDTSNIGFLEEVAASRVPAILLGAGGALARELEVALRILSEKRVVVLLGFQSYPTPTGANQLSRVSLLADRFKAKRNVQIGFADHASPESALRYALAANAIGLGARVIEKHLTLGRVMQLEDHESALNPDEFAEFCDVLRGCAAAFGDAVPSDDFGMSAEELGYRKTIRRSVVTSMDLPAGTSLAPAHFRLKRCDSDRALSDIDAACGKNLTRALAKNTPLTPDDIA
jgi:N,N'-diacetyllegionaminate synthase